MRLHFLLLACFCFAVIYGKDAGADKEEGQQTTQAEVLSAFTQNKDGKQHAEYRV